MTTYYIEFIRDGFCMVQTNDIGKALILIKAERINKGLPYQIDYVKTTYYSTGHMRTMEF